MIVENNRMPYLIGVKNCLELGFSRSSFYRMMDAEGFPKIQLYGRTYIHRDSFFEWCSNGRETTETNIKKELPYLLGVKNCNELGISY